MAFEAAPGKQPIESELAQIVSAEEIVRLADEFGGTRLYIPLNMTEQHRIALVIGIDTAKRLSGVLAGTWVRVPLMRGERACRHRHEGKSISWIARKLGMTETGVDKLLARSAKL